MSDVGPTPAEIAAAVRSQAWWYHTMELAPGVVTPGFFDCRPVADRVPWPASLAGLRCLDVGTHDGFWAFEMERRGAAEVVAVDLDDVAARDWPIDAREQGPSKIHEWGLLPGPGFRIAAEAIGSGVKRVDRNVYDLSPEAVGTFDLVFVGSLLVHLRDPVRALEAIRSVTRRWLVLSESVDPWLELWARRTPAARLSGIGTLHQWWVPNRAGLAQLLAASGFVVRATTRPYVIPYGRGRLAHRGTRRQRTLNLAVSGVRTDGGLHVGVRADPSSA